MLTQLYVRQKLAQELANNFWRFCTVW